MGRPKVAIPKYCLHASSGRAVVYINRKPVYLGRYRSPESKEKYGQVLAGLPLTESGRRPKSVTIDAVCFNFEVQKLPKYKTQDGEPSAEQDCYYGVIRILRELFGATDATTFGPLKFRKVREAMIAKGWCRQFINKQCHRLRFIFRIGAGWELIPASVVEALRMVEPLRHGDSSAPESVPRQAVPPEHIAAAKRHLRQRNQDLIDLTLATAARPGEILSLTTEIIDQGGEVWSADLAKHKTAHHGHTRTLFFGERAQAILAKYLKPHAPKARLFPIRRSTFGDAVKDACIKAGIPPFTPHWLRHTAITMFADETDLESAQRIAGHSTTAMTELYATAARKKARDAVKKLG